MEKKIRKRGKMSNMCNSMDMNFDQIKRLFSMLKNASFKLEKTRTPNICRVSSDEECKYMFRKVKKSDEKGKPRIELWRYTRARDHEGFNEDHMIIQCSIDI